MNFRTSFYTALLSLIIISRALADGSVFDEAFPKISAESDYSYTAQAAVGATEMVGGLTVLSTIFDFNTIYQDEIYMRKVAISEAIDILRVKQPGFGHAYRNYDLRFHDEYRDQVIHLKEQAEREERKINKLVDELLHNPSSKDPQVRKFQRRIRWKKAGLIPKSIGFLAIADGMLRIGNTVGNRDSGIVPLYSFTEALLKDSSNNSEDQIAEETESQSTAKAD